MSNRKRKFQMSPNGLHPGDRLAEAVNVFDVLELEKGRKLTISEIRQLRQSNVSELTIIREGNGCIQTRNGVPSSKNLKRKAG